MYHDLLAQVTDGGKPPVYKNLIAGTWTNGTATQTIDVISPVDQSVIGKIPACTEEDIHQAVVAVQQAQPAWAALPRTKRAAILHEGAALLRQDAAMLIDLLIMEIGKNHVEAKDEIFRSADMIDAFAQAAIAVKGDYLSGDGFSGYDSSRMALVDQVPWGVVLAIPPFNYPVNLSVAKIAPALMTGNGVIVKPPIQGALSCLSMIAYLQRAGLPAGILSSVTGEGATVGNLLVQHAAVTMIAFTGSSPVGAHIAKQAGMKPMLFECGGNNAAIVLPDAEMDLTAGEIVKGAFSYSGQRCTAIKYVITQPETLKALVPKVVDLIHSTVSMGNPREKNVTFGPLISEKAAIDIETRIQRAIQEGAQLVTGGKRVTCFIEPTVLTHVRPEADIVKTEVFGPVLSFIEAGSIEEMMGIVNSSAYGLQASLFTRDEGAGIAYGRKLAVGSVQINSRPQRGPDHFPFLGIKASGIGVQGISQTLQAMTRPHVIVLNNPQ